MTGPWRKVVKRYFVPANGATGQGSYIHNLECGHYMRAKKSHGTPTRKRCNECELRPPTPENKE